MGLDKKYKPSTELALVVGKAAITRGQVTKKLWAYIKKHDLQNENNKREILCDEVLQEIFGCKKMTMFEMPKLVGAHLS